jgi:hypothetical protein
MARIATLMVLALAGLAHAGPCEEGRERTGLQLVVRDGALVVTAVAPDSAAAASGVRAGDVVAQVNGTVAHSCAEWGRVVTDARDGGKALLLLVERGDAEVPLALGRKTWGEAEPTAVASGGAAERAPRPRPATPESPPPLPADVPVSVDSVVADLGGLVGRTRQGLAPYGDAVLGARRAVETLAVRKAAPPETVATLRRVARLHETAVLAWRAIDAIRERDGLAKRMPVSEATTGPYYADSPIQSMLDEFDFLQETIAVQPSEGRFAQSSGQWRPAAARRLAWEHAGEELGRVTATLAAAAP